MLLMVNILEDEFTKVIHFVTLEYWLMLICLQCYSRWQTCRFYVTTEASVCLHHGVRFAFLMAVNINTVIL